MIGRTVGQFRIVEKLGQGGMGVVYKAIDTRLNRTVALKFLPAHLSADAKAKARFIQEAQAASSLDHPSICTIFDIGETEEGEVFIAMAFYEGQTLKYRLSGEAFSPEDTLSIARQLARALARAHEAGIVHRDVKPANIMWTDRGELKLLDFGLAKFAGGAELTMAGTTLGTAAYMSPEQVRGDRVGPPSDVWAFGALVYELLTGKRAFAADYDQALLYGILNEDPVPVRSLRPAVPEPLSDLVSACLRKEPERRPGFDEILEVLGDGSSAEREVRGSGTMSIPASAPPARVAPRSRWLVPVGVAAGVVVAVALLWFALRTGGDPGRTDGAPGATTHQSVAVLPFRTTAGAAEDARAFADGMHDDVLTRLGQISDLRVISRTSMLQYEGTSKSIREIARELDVATVLEGSVQRSGNRVRVNVQLIDATTDGQLWAESYDEDLTPENVFGIQADLARQIAAAMQATLTPEEEARIAQSDSTSLEVYDLYTQAVYLLRNSQRGDETAIRRALSILEGATRQDPAFGVAYARMARTYYLSVQFGIFTREEARTLADPLIEKALALDPDNIETQLAKGFAAEDRLDFAEAEAAYRRAIELAPGAADGYRAVARVLYLMGRPEEAMRLARLAVQMDPLDIEVRETLADALFFTNDFTGSVAESRRILAMEPNRTYSLYNMGYGLMVLGQSDEALAAFERAVEIDSGDSWNRLGYAWALARVGRVEESLAMMNSVSDTPDSKKEKAIIYGELGDLDRAFALFEEVLRESPASMVALEVDASVPRNIREDPRFPRLLERLKK